MFKNLTIYRLNKFDLTASSLSSKLKEAQFNHCGSQTLVSSGFSPVSEVSDDLVREIQGNILVSFSIEKKLLPASVVKEFLKEAAIKATEQSGQKPGRRETKDIKEAVIASLLPKAFGVQKRFLVWIDPVNKWLCVNTASHAIAEQFLTFFFKCVSSDVDLKPINTASSPIVAMTNWLAQDSAPSGFTIDRDCLLKNPESKSSLRYSNHHLDDIAEHISSGKLPNELAMTWKDRVSFTLGSDWAIKKIRLLDIVMEGAEAMEDEDVLDADAMLCISELRKLLPDLITGMGGEE